MGRTLGPEAVPEVAVDRDPRPLGRSGAAGGGPSSSPPSVTVRPDGAAPMPSSSAWPRWHSWCAGWAPRPTPNLEHTIATTLGSPPDGVRWLISSIWWITSLGVIAVIAFMTLMSRRLSAIRDIAVSGATAWLLCVLSARGARDRRGAAARSADTPTSTWPSRWPGWPPRSRWSPRPCRTSAAGCSCCLETAIGLLAVAAVVNGSGVPLAVLASLAVGWGVTAVVHLVFGSPLGLPSADEVQLLLGDLEITAVDVGPTPNQEWGVGRFGGHDRRRPGRRLGLWARRLGRPAAGQDGPLPLLPGLRTHPGPDPAPAGRARGLSDPDGRSGRGPRAGGAGGRPGRPGPGRTAGHPPTRGPPAVAVRRLRRAAE